MSDEEKLQIAKDAVRVKIIRVYEDGQMLINKLPAEIERKFKMAGVPLPFRKEK